MVYKMSSTSAFIINQLNNYPIIIIQVIQTFILFFTAWIYLHILKHNKVSEKNNKKSNWFHKIIIDNIPALLSFYHSSEMSLCEIAKLIIIETNESEKTIILKKGLADFNIKHHDCYVKITYILDIFDCKLKNEIDQIFIDLEDEVTSWFENSSDNPIRNSKTIRMIFSEKCYEIVKKLYNYDKSIIENG